MAIGHLSLSELSFCCFQWFTWRVRCYKQRLNNYMAFLSSTLPFQNAVSSIFGRPRASICVKNWRNNRNRFGGQIILASKITSEKSLQPPNDFLKYLIFSGKWLSSTAFWWARINHQASGVYHVIPAKCFGPIWTHDARRPRPWAT